MAMSVQWHSFSSQVALGPPLRGRPPVVRLVADGDELPLARLAAQQCFWHLSLTELREVARHFRWQVGSGTTLFDVLFSMVQCALGGVDSSIMAVLSLRLASLQCDGSLECTEELVQLDEAAKLMEPSDAGEVEATKAKAQTNKQVFAAFSSSFKERRARVRTIAKPKASGSGRSKNATAVSLRISVDGEIEQAHAKQYMPPNSFVWQART